MRGYRAGVSAHEPTLRGVEPTLRDASIGVLEEAFTDDPTLRYCFAGGEPGYRERLRAYLEAGHDWHTAIGQPVQGAFVGPDLVGVLYGMDPAPPELEAEAVRLRARLEEGCGAESARRFFHYNQAMEAIAPDGPAHGVALIGVRVAFRRRGIGSALMDWFGLRCDSDPHSLGIVLDTGSDANLGFYARHGYRVIGEQRFGELLERVLLRPRTGAGG